MLRSFGLVTPYGNTDLGQHWLRQWLIAWQHLAITWTNVDLSSVEFSGIHVTTILLVALKVSIHEMSWKIISLKSQPHLPGANELGKMSLKLSSAGYQISLKRDPRWNISNHNTNLVIIHVTIKCPLIVWLSAVKQQVTTCTNIDPALGHHMI